MKKFLLSAALMIVSFAVFSQTPCPTQFSRNNGNGSSCAAHSSNCTLLCPAIIPTLDSIKIDGVLQPETFTILEKVCTGNNIYIDYCIGNGNLPPAAHLTVYLTYVGGATGGATGSVVCNVPEAGPLPVILSGLAFSVIIIILYLNLANATGN